MVAHPPSVDRRHPLSVSRPARRLVVYSVGGQPPLPKTETMTPQKTKKPTQAELIQTLLTQVAELRGRIEKIESTPPQTLTVYRTEEKPPVRWWLWS